MPIVHLGILDVPYKHPPKKVAKTRKGKANKPRPKAASQSGTTTGDVAEILEAKYHPMEVYFTLNEKPIMADMTKSVQGALDKVMMGGPIPSNPFAGAASRIETGFKKFLSDGGMEKIGYPGVPTKAALKGVNLRLAHPYAKGNPRRPSFINTSQYQTNFKCWVTG